MKSFIVVEPFMISGYYEEPIYDDVPEETYTSDINLTLNRYDVLNVEENGSITVYDVSFGTSMYGSVFDIPKTH